MELIRRLYGRFSERAKMTRVECLSVGLGYTAVVTDDGGIGISYSYFSNKHCCSMHGNYRDYESEPAIELLGELESQDPLHRSMALALVNALNYGEAGSFPGDPKDNVLIETFGIGRGTHVAMVGFFRPLVKQFEQLGAQVEILDDTHGLGDRGRFYEKLNKWAEVLILTATSILNGTTEDILAAGAPGVKTVMIGPSTPMVADGFRHLPVNMLAGMVPLDKEGVLKAVRHGAGTPVIHRSSRKAYLILD